MKALLSASFGTSHEQARRLAIDVIEEMLCGEFPDRAFYSAWTSSCVAAKVRDERGEHHDTLDEAFARISADGVDDLVVSTTCIVQGCEMSKIVTAARAWEAEGGRRVRIAKPLLATAQDCRRAALAMCDEFPEIADDEALLFMGHGTSCGSNEPYAELQRQLRELGLQRAFVATLEGTPTLEDVVPMMAESGAMRVRLAPFTIVAGDHARNDLAGSDDGSWACQLGLRGFDVESVLRGLGEYAGIRGLVRDHVRDALSEVW